MWAARMAYMRPQYFVELGTGQGASGAKIMHSLPANSRFVTINYDYPDNEKFGAQLEHWRSDKRLTVLTADTTDPRTLDMVEGGIDLLYIDTTHRAWHAALELQLWQNKLDNGAIVIVDDLGMHDMWMFWASVPYEKVPVHCGPVQGVFRYEQAMRHDTVFPRGRTSKEGQEC